MSNEIKVTMKNTKQEIMDALKKSQTQLKEKESTSFDPIKKEEIARNEEILVSANESVEKNLFSEELNKKFIELNEAIEITSKKLEEVYSVEREFQDLVIVVNSSKELQDKLNIEYELEKNELDLKMKKLENEMTEKQTILVEGYQTKKDLLELERQREIEKYEYDLKRKRDKEDDSWNDEKARRELEISKKEEEVSNMAKEAEEKKDYVEELEEKVENIPNLTDVAKEEGKEEATKELGREYGYKKSMAEKESTYEKQRLQDRLDSLSKELEKTDAEKDVLQSKLDEAYSQLSTLATKTVESSGGVKILSNTSNDTRK